MTLAEYRLHEGVVQTKPRIWRCCRHQGLGGHCSVRSASLACGLAGSGPGAPSSGQASSCHRSWPPQLHVCHRHHNTSL